MYNQGTIEEFNIWHEFVKNAENLPKPGYINGIAAPQNQQTISYSQAIEHPSGGNNYIWRYGNYPDGNKQELTTQDAMLAGWFADET